LIEVENLSEKDIAICFLVINKIKEIPTLSINSCLRNSNSEIYIGYIDEEHLENIPVDSRIKRIKIELPEGMNISNPDGDYTGFDKLKFFRLVTLKWLLFKQLFNLGYKSIIYSDLDVLWFRNVAAMLREVSGKLPDIDIFIQDQTLDICNPKLCMGLVFIRGTGRVLDLIESCYSIHSDRVEKGEFIGDDDVITDFYRENGFPSWISLLPQVVFPVGVNFNSYLKKGSFPGLRIEKPAIFHANFVIGERNKRLLMRMANREIMGKPRIGIYFKFILMVKRGRQARRDLLGKRISYSKYPN
jgi:hypothetical protein